MTLAGSLPPDAGFLLRTESSGLLRLCVLREDQWGILRDVRLTALRDSPEAFLSKHETEVTFKEGRWREEFSRGEWVIAGGEGKPPDALIGVTRSNDIPPTDRYLEYLWVSPKARRYKLATNLIHAVLERLDASGIDTAWLWILDGNKPARELYRKCGFTSTGERQRPKADHSRWEEKMKRKLGRALKTGSGIRLSLARPAGHRTLVP